MNYELSFSKTAVIALIVGSVLIGVLLFGAGLVVGSQWLVSSSATPTTTAKNQEAELPKEPVLNDEKAAPAKPAPPKTTAPPPKTPTGPANAPAQAAHAAAPPATNGEVKIIEEAPADSANGESATGEPEYVTVQVGVFLDQNEAGRLLKQIEKKGYAPTFFTGRDAEARQWYAVRIGVYSDKQQAANAAANFTKQEKIKAVVRPVESL